MSLIYNVVHKEALHGHECSLKVFWVQYNWLQMPLVLPKCLLVWKRWTRRIVLGLCFARVCVCQFASLYLLTEPRGWNSFWLKRAEQTGVDGKIKNRNEKGKIERGVSGEMEWYVARPRLIRQRWERKATDKRPTIGRKRSKNQKDLPGDFITDHVLLSLNGGCMLQAVYGHISVFKKCMSVCVLFCAASGFRRSGYTRHQWLQFKRMQKKCVLFPAGLQLYCDRLYFSHK